MCWISRCCLPLCLALALLGACGGPGSGDTVQKTSNPKTADTSYQVKSGLCSLKWTLRKHGSPPRYGIRESSSCILSMGDPDPLRDQLIGAIRADLGDLSSLKSFYWGSLKRANAGADVPARLAAEAASSSLWDTGKGVPRPGGKDVNETVQELLTTADAFREVKSTFHRVGLSVEVSHVEMVRVQPLQGDSIGGGRESGTLLLPVDGLVELSLHPEAPGMPPSATP